ncbi:MAG TPA: PKD domain-containing protein, partial [Chitinophagaceae bacterium]|nr:PKD domain-containing protein [Chitinophagaceae bacterium]
MRKLLYTFFLLINVLLTGLSSLAQDFSNKGKEFWIPYSFHVDMFGTNPSLTMTLYITSDVTTTYQVEIYGVTTLQTGTINAGQVVTCVVPQTYFLNNEGLFTGKTVRVTSVLPVVVYSYITQSARSGATVCLPTTVLGREYYSSNYRQISNSPNSDSYFTIIAVEDNTTVNITPADTTKNGWLPGNTYPVTLNKGQVYQVLGKHYNTAVSGLYYGKDLTGSKIESVSSGTSGCKRIAVFSGAGKIMIGNCTGNNTSSDNLYQQLYPVASWGKNYLTVPSYNRITNFYRVIKKPSVTTNVYVNGVLIPAASFINGVYYEFSGAVPNKVEADQPISVSQYFTTQGCNGNISPYDPDMIMLNPVEQNIKKVTLVSSNLAAANPQHHIHVIMRNGGTGISSFKMDNVPVPVSSWVIHPQDAAYSYLYLGNVAQGYHTLESDSGFNALAYGYANAESYGYSAGSNIKDLYQYVSIQNTYATVNFPATCRNTPFYFTMTFPYQPTSILWQFNGLFPDFNMPDPSVYFIGTIVVNGKTLYQYRIPTPYSIPNIGTYPIKVIAVNPTPDGCGNTQEINYDIQVFDNPAADFTTNNVCFPNPVQFTDISNTGGRPIISRFWDFGDNTTASISNPLHVYPAPSPPPYNARYAIITDIGCLSDTTMHPVTVYPLPVASVDGTIAVCQNGTSPLITFTGSVGTAPYTFTYNINGGPAQTVTSPTNSPVATVTAPTNIAGTFVYNLVSVQDASPAACSQAQIGSATITVNPLPTAELSGTVSVCQFATPPDVTFTGAAGTPPYTFTYNINGGPNQTVTTSGGNTATVQAPTGTVGTFVYNLVSVQDASSTVCSQNQSGTYTVNVNALPAASISGTTEVCKDAAQPLITFAGSGTTAPYTFTYTINGGPNLTVTSTGNVATVPVPTTTAGTFTYNLISVADASATLCSQAQTGSVTVIVHPLPSPAFSVQATPKC